MEGNFSACLKHVFAMDDGFANDASHHGGATNWGITAATLAHWRGHVVTAADVRGVQPDEAKAICHASYWNSVRGGKLSGGVDLVVFDVSVNSGPRRAVRILQEAVGVAADGLFGPVTMRAKAAWSPILGSRGITKHGRFAVYAVNTLNWAIKKPMSQGFNYDNYVPPPRPVACHALHPR